MVRNGSELQLNGQVFKFTGANCYYLLQKASDNSTRSLVSLVHHLADHVLRTTYEQVFLGHCCSQIHLITVPSRQASQSVPVTCPLLMPFWVALPL